MRRLLPFLLLFFAATAGAQQTQTTVTGTIVDPNSVPYYPATVLACLVPPTQNPTVAGAPVSTNPGVPYCVGPAQTSPSGTFQIPLYANSVIQCNNVACSTQWQFTVTASGAAPPAGTGPQNFQVVTPITSLTSQDISGVLTAAAPVLLNSGGGGGSVGPGTPTYVGCFSVPTNLQNCAYGLTVTPGVGVNIPAPTTIGGGSGTASFGMPSGAVSGCLTPTAGVNFICSDGTNNTFDASLNGGPYVPFGSGAPIYNIKSYGAICDFAHSAADTTAIKAAFTAVTATGGTVFFPHGGCIYDNSTSAYTFTSAANITLAGEGRGSIILFTTLANTGIIFNGDSPNTCSGVTVKDMNWQFQPNRTTRFGAYPISFEGCQNVFLMNMNFNNGNGAGVRIGNSTSVWAINNKITNFLANGYFTVDNIDLHFVNTTCINNGDGCEEYSFFDGQTQGTCHHITSTGMTSTNDNTGFVINGCQDVSVTNFAIDGAGGVGIHILQDNATTTTMFPDNVEVGNGSITNTGYGTNASNTTAAVALEIDIAQTPSTNQRIDLHDIHISHTAQRALFLSDHNTVNLNAHNIWIDDNGAAQVTGSGEAIALEGGNIVKLSNITSSAANRYSLRDDLASIVEVNHFTSINAQVGNTSAASIRKTGTGSLVMDGVNMIDTYSGSNRAQIQNSDTTGGQFLITGITSSCTINPCGVLTGFASPATLQPPASGFGSNVTYSSAACETAFGATTLSGATTTTGLNCLPANAIIDAVVYRITTTITTAANFTIGDAGSATRYCGTKTGLTAGTTGTCTAQGYYLNPTAAGVLITPNATPGAGAMRLLVYYHTWTAPTS